VKKSPEERIATPDQLLDLRHQSVAQIIYEDNRVSRHYTLRAGFSFFRLTDQLVNYQLTLTGGLSLDALFNSSVT